MLGGPISTFGTLSVDVGSSAGKIVQENANAQIAQMTGSAAAPSYTFAGNTNTGLYSPAINQLALSTSGTAALTVLANGMVGIGTSAPTALLHARTTTGPAALFESTAVDSQIQIKAVGTTVNPYLGVNSNDLYFNVNGGEAARIAGTYINLNRFTQFNTSSSGSGNLWLLNTASNGESSALALDSGAVVKSEFGYANTGAAANIAGRAFTQTVTNVDYVINNATTGVLAMFKANGLVGIGTAAPAGGLDVALTGTAGSAIIVPRDTLANRPSAPVNGMLRYNNSLNAMEGYINGTWSALSSGSSAGSVTNIATSTGLLGGPITMAGTLSVDVGSAANKIVQENANAQIAQMSGSAAAPSYTFAGNTNTGLFSPAVNQLALSSNGTTGLLQDASGRIGIGTTVPQMRFEVLDNSFGYPFSPAGKGRVSLGNMVHGAATGNGVMITEPLTGTGTSAFAIMKTNDLVAFTLLEPSSFLQPMTIDNAGRIAFSTGAFISPKNTVDINGALAIGTYAGANVAPANGLLVSGNVGVGTITPMAGLDVATTGTISSAIIVPRDTLANRPSVPVNGMIRYASDSGKLEAYQSGAWQNMLGGSASSLPLNGITAAAAVNTIDNLNFGQVWNWSSATTQTPLSLSANALSTGSVLSLSSSNPTLNSTSGLLNVANTGTSTSGVLARLQSNGSAASGLTVLANGSVGIGSATPVSALDVAGTLSFLGRERRRESEWECRRDVEHQLDRRGDGV